MRLTTGEVGKKFKITNAYEQQMLIVLKRAPSNLYRFTTLYHVVCDLTMQN